MYYAYSVLSLLEVLGIKALKGGACIVFFFWWEIICALMGHFYDGK